MDVHANKGDRATLKYYNPDTGFCGASLIVTMWNILKLASAVNGKILCREVFCYVWYTCYMLGFVMCKILVFVKFCRKNVPDYSAARMMNDLGFISFDLIAGTIIVIIRGFENS